MQILATSATLWITPGATLLLLLLLHANDRHELALHHVGDLPGNCLQLERVLGRLRPGAAHSETG